MTIQDVAARAGPGQDYWDDARLKVLIDGHRAGKTCGEVARELGISRSAVVGKSTRLGMRWGAAKNEKAPVKKPRARTHSFNQERADVVAPPEDPTIASSKIDPSEFDAGFRKTFTDLEPRDCRFPVGDPGAAGFFFCGRPRVGGGPYCRSCAILSYSRATPVARPYYRRHR